MSNEKNGKTPFPAPLAFRVGVIGHRPNRLQNASISGLTTIIREVLDTVKNEVIQFQLQTPGLYSQSAPLIRAISPLAEGVDRIFAIQALDAGYELCCIMPFLQAEFEKDFAPDKSLEKDSLEEFRGILTTAESNKGLTRFELDGNRQNETLAYDVCGKTVLNQSDILVVVWDGKLQGTKGGTEDTFRDALRMGVPIIWIDAWKNHNWQIITTRDEFVFAPEGERAMPSGANHISDIQVAVQRLLQLPHYETEKEEESGKKEGTESDESCLNTFYKKQQPWFTTAVVWKCFRDFLGDCKFPKPEFTFTNFEEAVIKEWPRDTSTPLKQMVDTLRPYYAWPDKLAVLYSNRYRSAFIITYLLAALAVMMALLPLAFGRKLLPLADNAFIAIEIVLMVSIFIVLYFGRKNHWHERWIDYRLMAESIRHLRLVAPLGGGRPFLQSPAHHKTYGQPESSWIAWYVRAVERFLGLPSVVVNENHMLLCLTHLSEYIDGQITYHETNQTRCAGIDRKLHYAGLVMLVLTIISCCIHLFMGVLLHHPMTSWLSPSLMIFLCGFLPALGAALAGINNQGEFKRISKRSKAMGEQLGLIKITVKKLKTVIEHPNRIRQEQFSVKTTEITADTARLLTGEVLDWRVVFLDRPLITPT